MALHTELQINRDGSELLRIVTAAVVQMPKGAKPVIGARMLADSLSVLSRIRQANAAVGAKHAPQRIAHLEALLEHVHCAHELLRSSWDQRLISTGRYGKAIKLTVSIGKQANGWRTKTAEAGGRPVASVARP